MHRWRKQWLVPMVCAGVAALAIATVTLGEEGPDPFAEKASRIARWIHEDLDAGIAKAQETGKPLLVSFR